MSKQILDVPYVIDITRIYQSKKNPTKEFCDECDGVGTVEGGKDFIEEDCDKCKGTGFITK